MNQKDLGSNPTSRAETRKFSQGLSVANLEIPKLTRRIVFLKKISFYCK